MQATDALTEQQKDAISGLPPSADATEPISDDESSNSSTSSSASESDDATMSLFLAKTYNQLICSAHVKAHGCIMKIGDQCVIKSKHFVSASTSPSLPSLIRVETTQGQTITVTADSKDEATKMLSKLAMKLKMAEISDELYSLNYEEWKSCRKALTKVHNPKIFSHQVHVLPAVAKATKVEKEEEEDEEEKKAA